METSKNENVSFFWTPLEETEDSGNKGNKVLVFQKDLMNHKHSKTRKTYKHELWKVWFLSYFLRAGGFLCNYEAQKGDFCLFLFASFFFKAEIEVQHMIQNWNLENRKHEQLWHF